MDRAELTKLADHLKNMLAGLVVAVPAFVGVVVLIWILANYGEQVLIGLLLFGLAAAIYGLGWSVRQKRRLVREGEQENHDD